MHRWGTAGKPGLLLLHANSYSAELYAPLLQPLFADYDVFAPDLPGHGRSRWTGRIQHWQEVADFYIRYFDQHPPETPSLGIGHSIGGIVLMLMSLQRPEWFHRLVLLDPVMLPKGILLLIRGLKCLSLTHRIPLARSARRRRTRFPDAETALAHYSSKPVFSRLEPQFLKAYVDTCMYATADGEYQLSCSPELESSIYQSLPLNVWSLPGQLVHPALFIIGHHSDTVNSRGVRRLSKMAGNHVVKEIPGGHLFPFEKPAETMALIREFLA